MKKVIKTRFSVMEPNQMVAEYDGTIYLTPININATVYENHVNAFVDLKKNLKLKWENYENGWCHGTCVWFDTTPEEGE